jgi:hypothetical protein
MKSVHRKKKQNSLDGLQKRRSIKVIKNETAVDKKKLEFKTNYIERHGRIQRKVVSEV